MQNILVPVDFSPTAFNAAVYAIEFAKQIGKATIVLYNAYQLPFATENGMTVPFFVNINDLKTNSEIALLHLKDQLQPWCNSSVNLMVHNSCNSVITGISNTAQDFKAEIIIMGITGASTTEQSIIGSNTLHVAKHIQLPLLIIPPYVKFFPIHTILLVSDYKDVYNTTPVNIITTLLDVTKANLQVLYVQQPNKVLVGNDVAESISLNTMFQGYDPQYHYSKNENFIDGVNDFVEDNAIDMILIVPKHFKLIDKLFHKSRTKMMVYHSYVPVVVVHEK